MPANSKAKNPQGIEILFTESDHKYTSIINNKLIEYISGTTFISKFFMPFDPDGLITERCARKAGISVDEIKEQWKQKGVIATTLGTKIHETIEDVLLNNEFRNSPVNDDEIKLFNIAESTAKKLKQTIDILGVEKIVFNHNLKLAGSIDLFARSKKDGTYLIIDHKTNKEIKTNNYGKFALDPISHIPDSTFYHYVLQLNLYAYLLKYGKYVPADAKFKYILNHVTTDGQKFIELPDVQTEISHMILYHILNKEK